LVKEFMSVRAMK